MRHVVRSISLSALAVCLITGKAFAQSPERAATAPQASDAPAAHHHHAAVAVGAAFEKGHIGLSLGADYTYFPEAWGGMAGAGVFADYTISKTNYSIFGASVTGKLSHDSPLRIFIGPGVEVSHGHYAALVRGGAAFDLHFGAFTVGPVAFFDYVSKHFIPVASLAVGVGF